MIIFRPSYIFPPTLMWYFSRCFGIEYFANAMSIYSC